jgi:lysozyme
MSDLSCAINLIRKYEGFNEKAYPDPTTGAEPYTFGYGTQFYPDGSPVRKGNCCSKEKALEYLFHEVNLIETQLLKFNFGLDSHMLQALISFVHSIGWEPFLYTSIIDNLELENYAGVTQEMGGWIFDADHKVIGGLLDRRREEIDLFIQGVSNIPGCTAGVLLAAFRNYTASAKQVNAIRQLEEAINPYVLSEFANNFQTEEDPWGIDKEDNTYLLFDR